MGDAETTTGTDRLPPIFFDTTGFHNAFSIDRPFWKRGVIYSTDCSILLRTVTPVEKADAVSMGGCIYIAEPRKTPSMQQTWGEFKRGLYIDQASIPISEGLDWFMVFESRRIRNRKPVLLREACPVPFQSFYLWILRKHGVDRLWLRRGKVARKSPAYFAGDGFEGLIMPMTGG